MAHVSTLCAFGTVGIAAAGLALGCPESQPQPQPQPQQTQSSPTRRRRRSIFRSVHSLSQSVDLSARIPSRSGPFEPTPFQPSADDRLPSSPAYRILENGAPSPTIPRGDESPSLPNVPLRPRRRTYVGPVSRNLDGPRDDLQNPSSPQRPSTSWVRRLSTITASLHESSVSDSCPRSPSTFSSTAPFLPSHNAPPTPNKLVKRPTSQTGPHHAHSRSYSGLPTSTSSGLRRPATSHQRSAAMRQRSSTDSGALLEAAETYQPPDATNNPKDATPASSNSWRPFFGFGRPRPDRESGRRTPSARQRNRSPRRLVPEPGHHPTLLLATNVTRDTSSRDDSIRGNGPATMTRPVSSGVLEAKYPAPDANFAPSPVARQSEDRHALSVEERIACTPPYLFKSTATKVGCEHCMDPVSQERQDSPTAQAFVPPPTQAFRGSAAWQRRQHIAPERGVLQRPKTSSMAEANFDRYRRKQTGEADVPRSSLRRVPSFMELRSEHRIQARSGVSLSRPGSVPTPVEQTGSRVSSGSSGSIMGIAKNSRHSAAGSDPSSTLTGSDIDARVFTSGDEDDTDFQSDTAFDSFSTRAAGCGGSGRRGPPIETIFRRSPDVNCSVFESTKVNAASANTLDSGHRNQVLNKQPSPSAHTELPGNDDSISFTWSISTDSRDLADPVGTSPDERMRPLLFGPQANNGGTWRSSKPQISVVVPPAPNPDVNQPHSPATLGGRCEGDTQKSLFDWSEQQQNNTRDGRSADTRPRTAYGKQLLDTRGGRSSSRGPPSSLHLRSQSVPLSRDLSMSKESLKSSKFATWGLGNKGASEDWDEDFEFDDSDQQEMSGSGGNSSWEPVIQTVKVPQTILERQDSLHGQFGHVQELTVLVEELKRLRIRAKTLHILDGPSSELWKEAQGIVNLATSEEEEEDNVKESPSAEQPTSSPSTAHDDLDLDWSFENAQSKLTNHLSSYSKRPPLTERINPGVRTMPPLRTGTSARSRNTLDTLYQERDTKNPAPAPRRKLHFDTQSLRDLAVRAGVVTRALKEVVRRAEGVFDVNDGDARIPDPPFRSIFSPLSDDLPPNIRMRTRPDEG